MQTKKITKPRKNGSNGTKKTNKGKTAGNKNVLKTKKGGARGSSSSIGTPKPLNEAVTLLMNDSINLRGLLNSLLKDTGTGPSIATSLRSIADSLKAIRGHMGINFYEGDYYEVPRSEYETVSKQPTSQKIYGPNTNLDNVSRESSIKSSISNYSNNQIIPPVVPERSSLSLSNQSAVDHEADYLKAAPQAVSRPQDGEQNEEPEYASIEEMEKELEKELEKESDDGPKYAKATAINTDTSQEVNA